MLTSDNDNVKFIHQDSFDNQNGNGNGLKTIAAAQSFEFQVNYKLSVKALGRKPSLKLNDFKHNHSGNWQRYQDFESFDQGLKALIDTLERGYTVRYGIKETSNKLDSFEVSYGAALDLDCRSRDELDIALDSDIAKLAFYGHPSYSYDGVSNFGYRLHFRFSRCLNNVSDVKLLNYSLMLDLKPDYLAWFESRALVELEGLDSQCNDPARIWYSGDPKKLEHHRDLIKVNLEAYVNVDTYLDSCEEIVKSHVLKQKGTVKAITAHAVGGFPLPM